MSNDFFVFFTLFGCNSFVVGASRYQGYVVVPCEMDSTAFRPWRHLDRRKIFFTLSFHALMTVATHLFVAAIAHPYLSLTTAKSLRTTPRTKSTRFIAGSPAVLSKILVGL